MSEKRKARIFNTLMFVRVRKMLIAKIKQKKKKKVVLVIGTIAGILLCMPHELVSLCDVTVGLPFRKRSLCLSRDINNLREKKLEVSFT